MGINREAATLASFNTGRFVSKKRRPGGRAPFTGGVDGRTGEANPRPTFLLNRGTVALSRANS